MNTPEPIPPLTETYGATPPHERPVLFWRGASESNEGLLLSGIVVSPAELAAVHPPATVPDEGLDCPDEECRTNCCGDHPHWTHWHLGDHERRAALRELVKHGHEPRPRSQPETGQELRAATLEAVFDEMHRRGWVVYPEGYGARILRDVFIESYHRLSTTDDKVGERP